MDTALGEVRAYQNAGLLGDDQDTCMQVAFRVLHLLQSTEEVDALLNDGGIDASLKEKLRNCIDHLSQIREQFSQDIQSTRPIHADGILHQQILREIVREKVLKTADKSALVFTNIKLFADHAEEHYLSHIQDVLEEYASLDIVLSKEPPHQFKHDFVGLLQAIQHVKEQQPQALSEEGGRSLHAILDGGRKTRNYLLTLCFGYQGLFQLINMPAWKVAVEASKSISLQLPGGGSGYLLLSASDYDLVPSHLHLGTHGGLLADLKECPDFILFTSALSERLQADLQMFREKWADQIEGFQKMDSAQAHSAIKHLAEGIDVDRGDKNMLMNVADELYQLTTKGIALADDHGKLVEFREKPPIPQLVEMSSRGSIAENVMYSAIHKRRLLPMLRAFSSHPSVSHPPPPGADPANYSLRHVLPFGFFATLFGSTGVDETAWLEEWARGAPKHVDSELWREDGAQLRKIALEVMDSCTIVCATLGADAAVSDLGEPWLYLKAAEHRSFVNEGRARGGLPLRGKWRVRAKMDSSCTVEVEKEDGLFCYNTVICGQGCLRIRNSGGGRVVLSNSMIYLPKGRVLEIISGSGAVVYIESSRISVSGVIKADGRGVIVAGFDSSVVGCCDANNELSLCNEIVTSLSFLPTDTLPAMDASFCFPIDVVANRVDPRTGVKPLDVPFFGGRNFDQAMCSLNHPKKAERHTALLWDIRKEIQQE